MLVHKSNKSYQLGLFHIFPGFFYIYIYILAILPIFNSLSMGSTEAGALNLNVYICKCIYINFHVCQM